MNRKQLVLALSISTSLLLASCATTQPSATESQDQSKPTSAVVPEQQVKSEIKSEAKKELNNDQDPVTASKSSPLWTDNPAPSQKLSDFGQFEIKPLTMNEEFAENEGNVVAKGLVQTHINSNVLPILDSWSSGSGKTLLIEPNIAQIRFVSGNARFWGGALAGNSRILLSVKLIDKATGQVIATPVFYQRANGYAAAWSFGSHDKTMLLRVAVKMKEYLETNYPQAVGGKTGRS